MNAFERERTNSGENSELEGLVSAIINASGEDDLFAIPGLTKLVKNPQKTKVQHAVNELVRFKMTCHRQSLLGPDLDRLRKKKDKIEKRLKELGEGNLTARTIATEFNDVIAYQIANSAKGSEGKYKNVSYWQIKLDSETD